jgi:hypothetical protein
LRQSGGNESEKPDSELNQYSESVKKRIDKLTARLRETQRREEAAISPTHEGRARAEAQQMQQRMFRTDEERLHEAKGRIETQVVALKQIVRKAREEGDIDTETEANQRHDRLDLRATPGGGGESAPRGLRSPTVSSPGPTRSASPTPYSTSSRLRWTPSSRTGWRKIHGMARIRS